MTLVFLDTETTGLADNCDIWEIGLIVRSPRPDDVDDALGDMADHIDTEHGWRLRPDLTTAEPTGLRIGRFYDRMDDTLLSYGTGHGRQFAPPKDEHGDPHLIVETRRIAQVVARLLDGATIVGAVPDFDARHLARWLRAYEQAGTWHYHLVDVETLAAGALKLAPPWDFDKLLAVYGLTYNETQRHTALGDARMVRDLYDAVLAGGQP
jgi:hypothetical protein